MKHAFSQQAWKANGRNVIAIAALCAFSFGTLASGFFARSISDQARQQEQSANTQTINSISSQLTDRMTAYEQVLLAGAALLHLDPNTSQSQWSDFTQNLRINERYPSTLGFGYVSYIRASDLDAYEQKVRDAGNQSFAVRPAEKRDVYTSITYLEPRTAVNERAKGYDMFTEEVRHAAMQKAIDTAAVAITEPVSLVQFANQPSAPKGVLLYYPIYSTDSLPSSVTERRNTVTGFTYVVLQPENVLQEITEGKSSDQALIELRDTTPGAQSSVIADSALVRTKVSPITQNMLISDRSWSLSLAPAEIANNRRWLGPVIFLTGSILSMLSAVAVYSLLMRRVNRISQAYDEEIQQTKDDMLALASHQLRTPASGVKQYIGMLTQGYAGKLTKDQKDIAEKAYIANDRQLEIINQMLYVAKADAGQLLIEPSRIDLHEIAQNSIAIQQSTARSKKVKLKLEGTQPVRAYGDSRYILMIVENLINNAIKYSFPNSEIILRTFVAENKSCLSVSDQGVGITEEDMSTIFEKFARVENPLSKSEGGNGLGLYLAHGLAEAHGGNLTVTSELGVGSTFTLCLPRQRQSKASIRVHLNQITTEAHKRERSGV